MEKLTLLKTYLRGIVMGIADLVPGISGGTLAFIMGIYEKLINAITQINFQNILELFQLMKHREGKKFWKKFKQFDFFFLLLLFLGIFTSIMLFSKLIHYLYETHTSLLLLFFIGLIVGSIKIIYDDIPKHKLFNIMFGFGGFLLGISLLYFKELTQVDPSFIMIFLAGFLAVAALFLPGISGSFILLILGMYGFILDLLQDIFSNFFILLIFILGAIVGMITISRFISYLFKQDKSKTLYVLLGFVVGSLVIPIKNSIPFITSENILYHIGLFLLGLGVVIIITLVSKKKTK